MALWGSAHEDEMPPVRGGDDWAHKGLPHDLPLPRLRRDRDRAGGASGSGCMGVQDLESRGKAPL